MITKIEGEVIAIQISDKLESIDVMLPLGLAYRVHIPAGRYKIAVGSRVSMFTTLQVREDNHTLYGFVDENSREMFNQLIAVSGVGPKTALSILSLYEVPKLISLIAEGDYKSLSKASGLGAKGAQKIIVEMKGRFDISDKIDSGELLLKELKQALMALGFKNDELAKMVQFGEELLESIPDLSIEKLIQSVLKNH